MLLKSFKKLTKFEKKIKKKLMLKLTSPKKLGKYFIIIYCFFYNIFINV